MYLMPCAIMMAYMALIVMILDVSHVHSFRDAVFLIDTASPVQDMGIVMLNCFQVALKVVLAILNEQLTHNDS
jgi:hypothetical protein